MLDGLLLEQRGIPAVSIITDGFIQTGRAITRLWGVPDYEFISMPHPLSYLRMEQLRQQADLLISDVREMLLQKAL